MPIVCTQPENPCLVSVCKQDDGLCGEQPVPSGTGCSDDNECTLGDHCDGGSCIADSESHETICAAGDVGQTSMCREGECRPRLLALGREHACLGVHGAIRCWGLNGVPGPGAKPIVDQRLGYHGFRQIALPASDITEYGDVMVGGGSGGENLSGIGLGAGWRHTCALLINGNVRCWGKSRKGALGYGAATTIVGYHGPPSSAGSVSIGGTAVMVEAGSEHTCAVLSDSRIRCWGLSDDGRLGYGNSEDIGDDELPSSVEPVSVGGDVVSVALGSRHTCALLASGAVTCWGAADLGQLGYGNTDSVGEGNTPADVGPVNLEGALATQVIAGDDHTCALMSDGGVRCWGSNWWGVQGLKRGSDSGHLGDDELPSSVGPIELGGAARMLAAGAGHTCALLADGTLRCWGQGDAGQLGYGSGDSVGDDEHPSSVGPLNIGGIVVHIAAGGKRTCALLDDGRIRCWGDGIGDDPGEMPPADVVFE